MIYFGLYDQAKDWFFWEFYQNDLYLLLKAFEALELIFQLNDPNIIYKKYSTCSILALLSLEAHPFWWVLA